MKEAIENKPLDSRKATFGRREFLTKTGVLSASAALSSLPMAAAAQQAKSEHGRSQAKFTSQRKLGSLAVSSVGLGVQNMSRKYDTSVPYRPDMIAVIRAAHDQGVTFFDTAEAYGPLECERILGESIAPFRNQVAITTKFGFDIDPETGRMKGGLNSQPAHVRQAVEASLKRLRTDHIDLLYQHRVDPKVPIEDVAGAVKELMDEGKVLHWGLSEMGLQTLRRAHAVLPLTAVQSEYSMFWRGPEQEVIPTCEELGIGFVPWSPLGQQFLTGWVDANTRFAPTDFRAGCTRFAPENLPNNLKLVALLKTWAERKQAAPSAIALAWLMAQKPWIVPIPGSTVHAHVTENISAAQVKFTSSEIAELNTAVRAVEVQGKRLPDFVQSMSGVEAAKKQS